MMWLFKVNKYNEILNQRIVEFLESNPYYFWCGVIYLGDVFSPITHYDWNTKESWDYGYPFKEIVKRIRIL